jgi:hypothetical protein
MKQNEIQLNVQNHTEIEKQLFENYANYFDNSPISNVGKLQNFVKYIRRQDLSRFLAKHELFKLQLDIPGSIIECGCFQGGGTLTFAQLSAIYEPYNHTRKIIAVDTFEGFPSMSEHDLNSKRNYNVGELCVLKGMEDEIEKSIELFDKNRPLSHIPKIELIKGDATKTIPQYLENNKHLIVSMIYFDFDIYEPTVVGLKYMIERMPKGAILAFDELNAKVFPGETLAVLDTLGIKNIKLRKTMFDSYISYAIIE